LATCRLGLLLRPCVLASMWQLQPASHDPHALAVAPLDAAVLGLLVGLPPAWRTHMLADSEPLQVGSCDSQSDGLGAGRWALVACSCMLLHGLAAWKLSPAMPLPARPAAMIGGSILQVRSKAAPACLQCLQWHSAAGAVPQAQRTSHGRALGR
jgi:hypothetical protein